jgi:serine/threonine protein kinase/Tfp pilus assembly protein PilF
MIGKTISHYKILEKLGEGGMGVVYKAQDTKLKRIVALKFLTPRALGSEEEKARFINEAQAAAALDHPNICTIYEIEEAEKQVFIAMNYIQGQSLKDKIASGTLKPDEAMDIAIQIAQGLYSAHEKGIVHRDIKSANVMVTEEGQAKIMDFGLAKLAGSTELDRVGTTMGTMAYMSPEQVRGEQVSQQTDIWSLGVVLYEMLTAQLPFKGEYEQAVVYSILNEDPDPIFDLNKEVSESLHAIVSKALQKDISQRYQTIGGLLKDLQEVKKGIPVIKKAGIKKGIKTGWAILISAALALTVILMVWFSRGGEKQISQKIPIGVMFFDNQTGDSKYDYLRKVLADMLITDLSQSRYLQVMTFQRMFDLLRSLGYQEMEIIDAPVGFELCKLAGVHVMVLGSLMKSGETFALNTQVLDVNTKRLIASPYRVTGKGEDSILGHLVDDLTDKIKKGMEISIKEIQQEEKNIIALTTTSLEAYKYYFAGREAAYRMYNQEAIDNLEKAVTLDPTFAEAYNALARQYYTVDEKARALETIEKGKAFSGKLTEEKLVEILALEAYFKHDWDLAIKYYKRLININPENIGAHGDLGTIYYQRKTMYDEGIAEFEKVLELDPQGVTHYSSFTYNLLGWAYLRKGEFKRAHEAFKKYVALLPNQAYPLVCLGDFYLIVGNYDQAIICLQRSLKIDPDYPLTSTLLGETYLAKGMYNQALRSCERYLALSVSEAKKAEAHYYLGRLYYLKGDYEKSVQECEQAQKLNPQMVEALWIRGLTFLKKEKLKQAESEVVTIEELIEKRKTEESRIYYYHLTGELSLAKGLNQQALENFSKAANIKSLDRPFFINALGEAYFKIGELSKAIEELEAVFETNPNYAQTHYLLGLIYQKRGQKEKARGHFQKFMDIWKDADENLPQLIEAKKRLETL